MSAPISRRRALVLGGAGAAALVAGTAGWLATGGPGAGSSGSGGAGTAVSGADLVVPQVLDSRGGRLQVELVAAPGVRLAGRDTRALGFDATSPGPTLRVRAGDELAVRLTNRLDLPTNLHTHGLRVSPQGNGDNPFIRIDPGGSFDYLIRIPADHPPGTYWYHPHHHGTVADQVFGGLAGALIVDGGPQLPVAADHVLLVGDITLDTTGGLAPISAAERMQGREGALVLVDGQHQPVIAATPQVAQRWRIINACVSRVLSLRLDGHQLTQIAQDGHFLPAPTGRDRVVLAPGNRADVVVTPAGTGRFALITDPYDRGMGAMMGGAPTTATAPITLATMACSGAATPSAPLPATLPAEPPPPPATAQRTTTFQMGMTGPGRGGGTAMGFAIDGREFDPARTDHAITAGTVEEWTVRNTGPLAHPFHLHVWPFTVTARSDGAATDEVPRDVVLVPPGGWVRIRIPFTTYSGRSVYHCHILDHEDLGMMATVDVGPH